jgi:hypothetical protein
MAILDHRIHIAMKNHIVGNAAAVSRPTAPSRCGIEAGADTSFIRINDGRDLQIRCDLAENTLNHAADATTVTDNTQSNSTHEFLVTATALRLVHPLATWI